MSLVNAFEIITLAGIGLSLFAIAAFEISDAKFDRLRFAANRKLAAYPARGVIFVKTEAAAAANQSADVAKAA